MALLIMTTFIQRNYWKMTEKLTEYCKIIIRWLVATLRVLTPSGDALGFSVLVATL